MPVDLDAWLEAREREPERPRRQRPRGRPTVGQLGRPMSLAQLRALEQAKANDCPSCNYTGDGLPPLCEHF